MDSTSEQQHHATVKSTSHAGATAVPPLATPMLPSHSPFPSPSTPPEVTPNPVLSLFRRLLAQSDKDDTAATNMTHVSEDWPPSSSSSSSALPSPQQRWQKKKEGVEATTPPHSPLQHRLKIAVVGESESGRTTLSRTLYDAAERKTAHPLVVSGHAAVLKMDPSVLSVQTYDVTGCDAAEGFGSPARREGGVLEVTVIDSGPAPLSGGTGSTALMEADAVLLCVPLYGVKQVVPQASTRVLSPFRSAKPTEAFIHARDCQLLATLLVLLSTRCGVAGDPRGHAQTAPSVFLVGTFQDVLKDASVAATQTILRALRRLCDCVRQRSPCILPVMDVFAVSATQATAVSLTSEQQFGLHDWWRLIVRRTLADAGPSRRPSATAALPTPHGVSDDPFISPPALRHLLAHPSSLRTLHAGVRQICYGHGSPRLLHVSAVDAPLGSCWALQEVALAETRADDAKVASLIVDFIAQLKARKRVWMLPLPKLWRVAYALGMQTREQLYLVLRQMEATGEVALLGRGLSYTLESCVGPFSSTNETVCLCPALLRTSYSILYVYTDWVARRQRRHVRRCLRGVNLDECAARDPKALAAKGTFPLPLLRHLSNALSLEKTSPSEAAELLISVLVGSDVAYLVHDDDSIVKPTASQRHGPLHPPLLNSSPSSSPARTDAVWSRSGSDTTAVSPLRSRRLGQQQQPSSSADAVPDDLSSTSSAVGDFPQPAPLQEVAKVTATTSFSPNVTVAELTSLFLLGELTASPAGTADSGMSSSVSSSGPLGNTSFDPLRVAMQRTGRVPTSARRTTPSTEDGVLLVVPSMQPSALCPAAVTRCILSCAGRATPTPDSPSSTPADRGKKLRSSQVLLRVDPSPYDLISLLTCRFASVALRVEKAYANAALLSFSVAQTLRSFTDHVPLFRVTTDSAATRTEVDGCCFVFCAPPSQGDTNSCAAELRLVCFADSSLCVARLEWALCSELRMFLLQRLPGVAVTPAGRAAADIVEANATASGSTAVVSDDCATVDDLLRALSGIVRVEAEK